MALLNMNCPLKEHLVFAKTVEWGARKREGERSSEDKRHHHRSCVNNMQCDMIIII